MAMDLNVFKSIAISLFLWYKVASPVVLEKVLEYLIANSSTAISGFNIAAALTGDNQKVSVPAVYDYIRYIVDACI